MTEMLFELPPRNSDAGPLSGTPLADRMRPRSLDEVEGPEEVLGSNGFLRRAIVEDRVPSLLFWGPPGVGKTTLARLIAAQTDANFMAYSAVATSTKIKMPSIAHQCWRRMSFGKANAIPTARGRI